MEGRVGHIQVLLAVPQGLLLSGLQRLIDEQRPQLAVVASAQSCSSAIEAAAQSRPDVVLLDVELLEDPEAAAVAQLAQGDATRVLVLGGSRDRQLYEAAILRGALGVVDKSETPEMLIKAIRKVQEGQLWLDRSTTGKLFVELSRQKRDADPTQRKFAMLTEREQEVITVLVKQPGSDNKTLASSLHMGEHTLRNHLSRIYDKLGVANRVELFVLAQRRGREGHRHAR